jgi:NCS1 family nucleobase:cation symporter-1
LQELFVTDPAGAYYYENGWNRRAMQAFGLAAIFSVATVWITALGGLSGFGWIIGAVLGSVLHVWLMRGISTEHAARAQSAGHH